MGVIDDILVVGVGVYCGHEAFFDADCVIEGFGDRG